MSESWLPQHQQHALCTAAHIDAQILQLGQVLHPYLAADPLKLTQRLTPTTEEVVLAAIAPLPQAVPRLFADALNQTRNLMEHCLFAEVESQLGRDLDRKEAALIEVPAKLSVEAFDDWASDKRRRPLGVFVRGSELYERLHRLQPFHRRDVDLHPLRCLAEHTNFAKHREPSVTLTRVGRVDLEDGSHAALPSGEQQIAEVGSVLASVPRGTKMGVSIWPEVVVRRPHTGTVHTLMHELGQLEEWVREQAVPILVRGRTDLPKIPPNLDLSRGYASFSDAWNAASQDAAHTRLTRRMAGEGVRRDLLEMLADFYGDDKRPAFAGWLSTLDESDVLALFTPVSEAALRGDHATIEHQLQLWRERAGVEVGAASAR